MQTTLNTLADRLKHARKAKNLSQSELARRVGMKQSSYWSLEEGEVHSTRFLLRLAKELGVSPEWLERGAGTMPGAHTSEPLTESEIQKKAQELTDVMLAGKSPTPSQVIECYNDMLALVRRWANENR